MTLSIERCAYIHTDCQLHNRKFTFDWTTLVRIRIMIYYQICYLCSRTNRQTIIERQKDDKLAPKPTEFCNIHFSRREKWKINPSLIHYCIVLSVPRVIQVNWEEQSVLLMRQKTVDCSTYITDCDSLLSKRYEIDNDEISTAFVPFYAYFFLIFFLWDFDIFRP